MKFIGQFIQDFIARFRNDVYLEDLTEAAQDHVVGVDAAGKLYKQDVSSGDMTGVDITVGAGLDISQSNTTGGDYTSTINLDLTEVGVSGSRSQILTDNGDGTVTSEAGFTWDDDNLNLTSSSAGKPLFTLETTNTDKSTSAEIKFLKDAANIEDNESIGTISFYADNDGVMNSGVPQETLYADIVATAVDVSDGAEEGRLRLRVASHDGEMQPGLTMSSGNAEDEVDITLGNGQSSIVQAPGTFQAYIAEIEDSIKVNGTNLLLDGANDQIVFTPSTNDTATISSGTNGTLNIETDDNNANAGHITIYPDGDLTANLNSTGDFDIYSDESGKPLIEVKSTNTTKTTSSELRFVKDAANVEDDEVLGEISFYGDNDGATNMEYANITSSIADTTNPRELGKLSLSVQAANQGGSGPMSEGLVLTGNNGNNANVDVTIGNGTESTTTIAGNLNVTGTGLKFNVPLKVDDLYILYVTSQNYWFHTGYVGQNLGTAIGSEFDSTAMRAVSYVAPSACRVNKVVIAFYMTSGPADLEFQVTKIPLVDGSNSNVTLAAMTHNDINFTASANYNYVKTMTMTGASDDNHLSAGQAFTLAVRQTASSSTRILYGNCFAEVELT